MLANIRQHAAYIASTVGYIGDQIAADSAIVTDAFVSYRIHFSWTLFSGFCYAFCSLCFSFLSCQS